MSPLLQAREVQVALGGHRVLQGIDLDIGAGWTAIVGPNGAGKSTLLRALAGLQPLGNGRVLLHGKNLALLAPQQRARQLAWLAQGGQTSGELTVQETVQLGRIAQRGLLGALDATDAQAVAHAMADTGCTAWAQRRLQALSGGECQRVLLARVLATEAPVLLLDEPTTHLDAPHQVALARLFARLARSTAHNGAPRAVVTVLHDLPIALHADRVLVLQAGRVMADGRPASTALHRALEQVFDHAVRVTAGAHRPQVALAIDDEPTEAAVAPGRSPARQKA